MNKWRQIPENIFHSRKRNGGKFLKICFTHEKLEAILGPQKIQKSKVLKIKIRSAQIVGEVFLCRRKASPPHLGPSRPIFSVGRKIQKLPKFCLFSLVGPWALFTRFGALAAIHPRWGLEKPGCQALKYIRGQTCP